MEGKGFGSVSWLQRIRAFERVTCGYNMFQKCFIGMNWFNYKCKKTVSEF